MNRIQFGPLYFPTEEGPGAIELAERAEEWGYDYYWVPDYVTLPYMDAFVLLGAVAQRTSRLRLGTAVVLAPFRTPFQFAKASASVDLLSQGRFTLGVGIGAVPRDFEIAQVDLRQRGRISDETLDIIRRLFSQESVSYKGRYYTFENFTIGPRPIQSQIPIWIGAQGGDSFPEGVIRRAGLYGDGFFPVDTSVEQFQKAQVRIKEVAASHGRDPKAIQWGLLTWLCAGPSKEEARETASREISKRLGQDRYLEGERGYALGTPKDMIETIQSYVEIGLTNFVIDPGCAPRDILAHVEVFAKEVIPHFR